MDTTITTDIQVKEPKLPNSLEDQIDKDIERSEQEIKKGEFMEAKDAFRTLREKHGFI